METIISAARGVDRRVWAFLAFLSDSGRRVGEARSMEWVWMRLDVEPAHIIPEKRLSRSASRGQRLRACDVPRTVVIPVVGRSASLISDPSAVALASLLE